MDTTYEARKRFMCGRDIDRVYAFYDLVFRVQHLEALNKELRAAIEEIEAVLKANK